MRAVGVGINCNEDDSAVRVNGIPLHETVLQIVQNWNEVDECMNEIEEIIQTCGFVQIGQRRQIVFADEDFGISKKRQLDWVEWNFGFLNE